MLTDNQIGERVEQIVTNRAPAERNDHYHFQNNTHFAVVDMEEFFAVNELPHGWRVTGYFGTATGFGYTIPEAVRNCMNNYRIYVKGF